MWGDDEFDQGLQWSQDSDQAELVFALGSLAAGDVATRVMAALHLQNAQISLYGSTMTARSALARISRGGKGLVPV